MAILKSIGVDDYLIGNTLWKVVNYRDLEVGDEFFRVYKNGIEYKTCNGNDYETGTEAEINILMEYLVRE